MTELLELLQISAPVISNTAKTIGVIAGAGMAGASSGIMIDRFSQFVKELRQDKLENRQLLPTEIIIGYRLVNKYRIPIIFDMAKSPHMLVCGLSQNGKTSMVEHAIKNKKCVLINTFDNDFLSIKPIIKANTAEEMEKVLKYLSEEMTGNTEPLFVVIDEILEMVLSSGKDVTKTITKLLATSAHNKIYVIAISQMADKDVVKFKNLFNTRVCFKMADDVNYKTCLGYMPESPGLKRREFYYYYDGQGMGQTYDV